MTPRIAVVACLDPRSGAAAGRLLASMEYEVRVIGHLPELLAVAAQGELRLVFVDRAFVLDAGAAWLPAITGALANVSMVMVPGMPGSGEDDASPGAGDSGIPAAELVLGSERLGEVSRFRRRETARDELDPFIGQSAAIRRVAEGSLKALSSESPVLIQGETGTGKGVLAAWLHRHGPRSREAMVDINCAGMSRELLDSDLFGHEKGAFTGAVTSKAGLLEVADRGTLFMDEVGEMDPRIQAKLLKVLEEKRFRRVGDTRERHTDVRIIAATNADLERSVSEGRFRGDLYFRICVLPIRIPPLRDRIEDIPWIARALLDPLTRGRGRDPVVLGPSVEEALMNHPWRGNIRELRSVLERALLANDRGTIELKDLASDLGRERELPAVSRDTSGHAEGGGSLQDVQNTYILEVLERCGGDKSMAARQLGVARSTLYQRLSAIQGRGRGRH